MYTLFAKSLPLDVASRVWDVFCRDGEEFLFRTALGAGLFSCLPASDGLIYSCLIDQLEWLIDGLIDVLSTELLIVFIFYCIIIDLLIFD